MTDSDDVLPRPMPLSGWIRSGSSPAVPVGSVQPDGPFWARHESRYRDAVRGNLRSISGRLLAVDATRLQGMAGDWRDPTWAVLAPLLQEQEAAVIVQERGVAMLFDAPNGGAVDAAVGLRQDAPGWGFRADEGDGDVGRVDVESGPIFLGGAGASWRHGIDELQGGPSGGMLIVLPPGSYWVRVLRPRAGLESGADAPALLVDLWPRGLPR